MTAFESLASRRFHIPAMEFSFPFFLYSFSFLLLSRCAHGQSETHMNEEKEKKSEKTKESYVDAW